MARARLRHSVKDRAGNSVQNALVHVYNSGTTTPVGDLFNASTGGSQITTLVSNSQGEIEGWLGAAKSVDLLVTDNSDSASYPGGTGTLSWNPFTENVDVLPSPSDIASTALANIFSQNQHFSTYVGIGPVINDGTTKLFAVSDLATRKAALFRGHASQSEPIFKVETSGEVSLFQVRPVLGSYVQHRKDTTAWQAALTVEERGGAAVDGNTHGIAIDGQFTQPHQAGNTSEYGGLFNKIVSTGTGRVWGQDNLTLGPTAAQANLLGGISELILNHHAGAGNSVGIHVVTARRGETATEVNAVRHPIDIGLLINGRSGDTATTTVGFTTAIQVGGAPTKGGWAIPTSRIGTGLAIQDHETAGITVGAPYSGSPIGLLVQHAGLARIRVDSTSAGWAALDLRDGSAGVDLKTFRSRSFGGLFQVLSLNDAESAEVELLRADPVIAADETSLWVRRDLAGVESMQRVIMGAVDSGGVGFRSLRVPN